MAQLEQDAIDQVTKIVTDAIAGQAAGAVKPEDVSKAVDVALAAALEKLPKADGASIKLDDVKKLVADELAAAQATQATAKADADKAAARKAKRDAFVAEKLKGVPAVYAALLPDTDDDAELSAAEATIRERFRSDLAASGLKLADVGNNATGTAVDAADVAKLSPQDKIAVGLKAGGSAPTT